MTSLEVRGKVRQILLLICLVGLTTVGLILLLNLITISEYHCNLYINFVTCHKKSLYKNTTQSQPYFHLPTTRFSILFSTICFFSITSSNLSMTISKSVLSLQLDSFKLATWVFHVEACKIVAVHIKTLHINRQQIPWMWLL